MGRKYSVPFGPTSVSAAVDVFEYLAASGKPITLHEVTIGQTSDYGDAQAEGSYVNIQRATGSYTSGSAGSTATPAKDTNDAAAGTTAELLNTTQASAGAGALTSLRKEPFNIQAGYQYLPVPERRWKFLPGEAIVVSIPAPADAISLTGTLEVEED